MLSIINNLLTAWYSGNFPYFDTGALPGICVGGFCIDGFKNLNWLDGLFNLHNNINMIHNVYGRVRKWLSSIRVDLVKICIGLVSVSDPMEADSTVLLHV